MSSELESKKELVHALRRDGDGAERLKTEAKQKDRELEELRAKVQRAESKASEAAEQLAGMREAEAGKASEEQAELEALRSELDARKTVIKSLRADQERVTALQTSLEEKRDIIEQLEASINRHSNTIAELRRSVDTWKRKYQAVKGDSPTATTSVNLPSLSDTDVRVIEQIEKTSNGRTDARSRSTCAAHCSRPGARPLKAAAKNNARSPRSDRAASRDASHFLKHAPTRRHGRPGSRGPATARCNGPFSYLCSTDPIIVTVLTDTLLGKFEPDPDAFNGTPITLLRLSCMSAFRRDA